MAWKPTVPIEGGGVPGESTTIVFMKIGRSIWRFSLFGQWAVLSTTVNSYVDYPMGLSHCLYWPTGQPQHAWNLTHVLLLLPLRLRLRLLGYVMGLSASHHRSLLRSARAGKIVDDKTVKTSLVWKAKNGYIPRSMYNAISHLVIRTDQGDVPGAIVEAGCTQAGHHCDLFY